MVLLLNGKVVEFYPDELRALLRDQPCSNEAYKFQKKSVQIIENNKNLLYLHQREMGIISLQDPSVCFLGTDDATTCHFVILDCINAGLIGGAHLDGCGTELFFDTFVYHVRKACEKYNYLRKLSLNKLSSPADNESSDIQVQSQFEISVFVVGGFLDDNGSSEKLSKEILMIMSDKYQDINFRLELFCVTDLNNRIKDGFNYPIFYGALYNTRVHKIYPASFAKNAKEPQHILRSTRFCCPQTIYNVYNPDEFFLQLIDFDYKGFENRCYYLQLSQAPDSRLRKMSTSPRQEKEGFESSLRSTFRFMYDNPEPKLSMYDGDYGIRYRCDSKSGEWIDYK